MDTIAKHAKKLVGQYERRKEAEEIILSAKQLVILVLESEHLLLRHRKKMLSEALWWISEADGKHTTRFRTSEVVRLAIDEPTSQVKVQHEHVYERKEVAAELLRRKDELLNQPERLNFLLDKTVGCIVTEEEHRLLKKGKRGWERYEDVVVYDMSGPEPTLWRPNDM